jgi:hypothetical protein
MQAALVSGKAQLALGGDRREQVDPEPVAGGGHHRGLPDRRPGRAGVVVRAHPGLVDEVDRGPTSAASRRSWGRSRPSRAPPPPGSADSPGTGAAAGTAPARAAATPPSPPTAAPRTPDRSTPAPSPGSTGQAELQLPGVIADNQGVDPLQLGPGQGGGRPGTGRALRPPASRTVFGQPAIDRRPGHAQPSGHLLGMGALFDLADGPEAQLLQVWWSSLRPSSSRMRGLDPIPTTSQLTCERLSRSSPVPCLGPRLASGCCDAVQPGPGAGHPAL